MNALPSPAIRLARDADAEAIACLSRDTIEAGLPWRWRGQAIRELIASARHNVIIAERDGDVAGFAAMSYGESDAYLALLAVAPAARRTGLARQLLGWLLKTADVAGTAVLRVDLRDDNLAARRLYLDAGFVESGRKVGGYYGRVDQVSMRLTLRPAAASV